MVKIFNVTLIGDGPHEPVVVMPDVAISPSTPDLMAEYKKDPSTGFFVDQITKGECEAGHLGDTRAFPQSGFVITDDVPQGRYAGGRGGN